MKNTIFENGDLMIRHLPELPAWGRRSAALISSPCGTVSKARKWRARRSITGYAAGRRRGGTAGSLTGRDEG
ncbi:MAG TPA: hypothetical protein VMV70_01460 [Gallionella sp.]|nr:hypothetical protein [Gallionella sp.]